MDERWQQWSLVFIEFTHHEPRISTMTAVRVFCRTSPVCFVGIIVACSGQDAAESDCSPGTEGCECGDGKACLGDTDCHSGICIDVGNGGGMSRGEPGTADGEPPMGDGDAGHGTDCFDCGPRF